MSKVVQSKKITEYESSSKRGLFYEVQANHTDDGHAYLSCNCPSWTSSRDNKGKQSWERTCKHTERTIQMFSGTIRLFDELLVGTVEWWLRGRQVSSRVEIAKSKVKGAKAWPSAPPKPTPKDKAVSARFDALEL